MDKDYLLKIYEPGEEGAFIISYGTKDFDFDKIPKQINSGLGQITVTIPRRFEDFDEGYVVKANNRVEIFVSDGDTGSIGKRIYNGVMSKYKISKSGTKEKVQFIALGGNSKLATSGLRSDSTTFLLKTSTADGLGTQDEEQTAEVADVFKKAIDYYRANATNPIVNYTADSIDDTGNTLKYTFDMKYFIDALNQCQQAAPAGWYFYIDADNIIYLKPKPAEATHTFIHKKHISSIDTDKGMEPTRNIVVFKHKDSVGADQTDIYSDADSISGEDGVDDRYLFLSDDRVSDQDTADNVGLGNLGNLKNLTVNTTLEILDNNGRGDGKGYDIESIEPGQTCQILNFDENTSKTFNDNMVIVSVDLYRTKAVLQLGAFPVNGAKTISEIKKQIQKIETDKITTGKEDWHEIGATGEPAFQNSWVNYNAHLVSPYYATAGFYKDELGFVHLKGLVKSGTLSTIIFTLPEGYRPLERHLFDAQSDGANGRVDVSADGTVLQQGGSTGYLSLEGIIFKAEQ